MELDRLADDGCPHVDVETKPEPVPREELVRMLGRLEWVKTAWKNWGECGSCRECKALRHEGHRPGCLLHRAITEG